MSQNIYNTKYKHHVVKARNQSSAPLLSLVNYVKIHSGPELSLLVQIICSLPVWRLVGEFSEELVSKERRIPVSLLKIHIYMSKVYHHRYIIIATIFHIFKATSIFHRMIQSFVHNFIRNILRFLILISCSWKLPLLIHHFWYNFQYRLSYPCTLWTNILSSVLLWYEFENFKRHYPWQIKYNGWCYQLCLLNLSTHHYLSITASFENIGDNPHFLSSINGPSFTLLYVQKLRLQEERRGFDYLWFFFDSRNLPTKGKTKII